MKSSAAPPNEAGGSKSSITPPASPESYYCSDRLKSSTRSLDVKGAVARYLRRTFPAASNEIVCGPPNEAGEGGTLLNHPHRYLRRVTRVIN
ncbi:hypothetical protein CEXT_669131 [Caerostris extrusa]|uniref:Uncharacterized protein n=1 Tax=Caerostris extrusa TaxID=172846 RepID=A0AAV4SVR7_CAEEX|nr:hypothetical protein CEXT_669131 [Caerostris extrusa]